MYKLGVYQNKEFARFSIGPWCTIYTPKTNLDVLLLIIKKIKINRNYFQIQRKEKIEDFYVFGECECDMLVITN